MARKRVIDMTTAGTLSKNQSGAIVTLDAAGGFVVTLPAPGRGLEYDFVVKTAITGAAAYYEVAVPSTVAASMKGSVVSGATNGTAKQQASSGASKLQLGTINGGAIGTHLKVICNNDSMWEVTGQAIGSGDTTIFV
jgi:cytoskeletal protein RodZ